MSKKVRDIVKILKKHGWRLDYIEGSHHHYTHPTIPDKVSVPGTRNKDLGVGLWQRIMKQAQIPRSEWP